MAAIPLPKNRMDSLLRHCVVPLAGRNNSKLEDGTAAGRKWVVKLLHLSKLTPATAAGHTIAGRGNATVQILNHTGKRISCVPASGLCACVCVRVSVYAYCPEPKSLVPELTHLDTFFRPVCLVSNQTIHSAKYGLTGPALRFRCPWLINIIVLNISISKIIMECTASNPPWLCLLWKLNGLQCA